MGVRKKSTFQPQTSSEIDPPEAPSMRWSTRGLSSSHREGIWPMPAVVGRNGFQRIMFEKAQLDAMCSTCRENLIQLAHGLQLNVNFY